MLITSPGKHFSILEMRDYKGMLSNFPAGVLKWELISARGSIAAALNQNSKATPRFAPGDVAHGKPGSSTCYVSGFFPVGGEPARKWKSGILHAYFMPTGQSRTSLFSICYGSTARKLKSCSAIPILFE
jgi:hypothetical protein